MKRRIPHRIRSLASVSLLFVCLAVTSVASGDTWVGDRYGWRGGPNQVQATTDAGRHWKVIYENGDDLSDFAQTGPGVGVVATGNPLGLDEAWTVDNGKHWFALTGGPLDLQGFEGHGAFLFMSEMPEAEDVGYLDQVTPWPPPPAYRRCKAPFSANLSGGPECGAPARPLKIRTVATIRGGIPTGMANVPGGIAAVFGRTPGGAARIPLFRVVVRRNNKTTVVPLPSLSAAGEKAFADSPGAGIEAHWPGLVVTAVTRGSSQNGQVGVIAIWRSGDGGQSWDGPTEATFKSS